MALFVIAEAVVVLAVSLALQLGVAALLSAEAYAALAEQPMLWMLVSGPFLVVASMGVVFLFRLLVDRREATSLGLGRPGRGWAASPAAGILVGLGAAGAPIVLLLALGFLQSDGVGLSLLTVAALPALILGAFNEELVFRGYLLRNMLDVGRPVWGVVVTSLLFALPHAANPHFFDNPLCGANIFLSGVALGLAYILAENVWFPTALHFGWNAAQGLLFGVSVSGYPVSGVLRLSPAVGAPLLLTGGEFGLEGSVLGTLATVVLILALGAAVGRRRHRERQGVEPALTGTPCNS
jgi:hypothetical protein